LGTNLKLWIYDPENVSRSLDSPGIFYKKSDGQWTFAGSNSDGTVYVKLSPGHYVFDTVEPNRNTSKYARKTYSISVDEQNLATVKGLQPNSLGYYVVTIDLQVPQSTFIPQSQCQLLGQDGSLSSNNGFPHRKERLKTSGVIKALFIPVDFPDVVGIGEPAEIYFEMAQGMNDFYRRVSGNQVTFEFQVLSKFLRMNFPSNFYNLGTWNGGDPIGYWSAALSIADPLVDFSKFDAVYVLSPKNVPRSSIAYGPAFPRKMETDDGPVFNGSFSGADAYQFISGAEWKWISHETGHLFGLHDLYTVRPQAETFGSWDIMSQNWSVSAIEMNSWNRYILGWLKESEVDCLALDSINVTPISRSLIPLIENQSGTRAQFIRLSSSKILVAEYRMTGGLDWIPENEEGVLVYTVDMTVPTSKGGWATQRRAGSFKADFSDAALRVGDSISVNSIKIEVISLNKSKADIRISKT